MRIRTSIVMVIATFVLFSCASSSALQQEKSNSGDVAVSQADSKITSQMASKKSSYQGEGLVIVVPSPKLTSNQSTDKWIPQFMQDSITTNLARYSKMTVIDRANEDLIIAEQKLSEAAYYDEENAIEVGKMTNAQLVCIGTIQKTASKYSVNFRVNDIETNEIKTVFSESYSLAQIEGGEAVQEVSKEILLGLGIELDGETITALSKSDDKSITSTKSLAKGMVAQENGDEIEALYQFMLAGENGEAGAEAQRNTQAILNGTISGASVREKYAQQQVLAEKWNKIFEQLGIWLERNLPIFVYDFSMVKDSAGTIGKVNFAVTPGIKVIPNRNAVAVYKKVLSQWNEIKKNPENKDWVKLVKDLDNRLYQMNMNGSYYFGYKYKAGLFALDGEKFAESSNDSIVLWLQRDISKLNTIPSQKQYFDEAKYKTVQFFSIPVEYLPDDFEVRLYSISREEDRYKYKKQVLTEKDFPVLSADEFKTLYNIK